MYTSVFLSVCSSVSHALVMSHALQAVCCTSERPQAGIFCHIQSISYKHRCLPVLLCDILFVYNLSSEDTTSTTPTDQPVCVPDHAPDHGYSITRQPQGCVRSLFPPATSPGLERNSHALSMDLLKKEYIDDRKEMTKFCVI